MEDSLVARRFAVQERHLDAEHRRGHRPRRRRLGRSSSEGWQKTARGLRELGLGRRSCGSERLGLFGLVLVSRFWRAYARPKITWLGQRNRESTTTSCGLPRSVAERNVSEAGRPEGWHQRGLDFPLWHFFCSHLVHAKQVQLRSCQVILKKIDRYYIKKRPKSDFPTKKIFEPWLLSLTSQRQPSTHSVTPRVGVSTIHSITPRVGMAIDTGMGK